MNLRGDILTQRCNYILHCPILSNLILRPDACSLMQGSCNLRLCQCDILSHPTKHLWAGPTRKRKKIRACLLPACVFYFLDFLFEVLAPLVRAPLELYFVNFFNHGLQKILLLRVLIWPLPILLIFKGNFLGFLWTVGFHLIEHIVLVVGDDRVRFFRHLFSFQNNPFF